MYELLKGLKKITTECYLIFERFYEARSRVYLYPTFYQSITEMAARQCFWYKIENNTLLIFKRKSKVVDSWTQLKNSTQTQLFKTTKSMKNTKCSTIRLYSQNQIEVFSFTERISKNAGIIVHRLRNYNSEINDISSVIHYYDCKQYQSDKFIKVYLNMGAAVGISGMAKSKHHLRPVAMVQIYKTQPQHKLSKNEFEKTKTLFQ